MDAIALLSLKVFAKDMEPSPKNVKLMDAPNKRREISKECVVSLGSTSRRIESYSSTTDSLSVLPLKFCRSSLSRNVRVKPSVD